MSFEPSEQLQNLGITEWLMLKGHLEVILANLLINVVEMFLQTELASLFHSSLPRTPSHLSVSVGGASGLCNMENSRLNSCQWKAFNQLCGLQNDIFINGV